MKAEQLNQNTFTECFTLTADKVSRFGLVPEGEFAWLFDKDVCVFYQGLTIEKLKITSRLQFCQVGSQFLKLD